MNKEIKEVREKEWGKAFINYLKEENTYCEDDFKYKTLHHEMKIFKAGFYAGKNFASLGLDEGGKE